MQRLFSGFPGGPAGLGLLLLRATAGGSLLAQGVRSIGRGAETPWGPALAGILIVDGLALVSGSLTPAAAALGATMVGACLLAPMPPIDGLASGPGGALVIVMALAVALIGPGAYSVDARLFGRREIELPRARGGA